MKTIHREAIKSICRTLSTIYFDPEFYENAELMADARILLTIVINATKDEIIHMLGHDIMEDIKQK